ncbi:hypothetical protein AURDEDRAFT_121820 [Auricularia subglabra TFB-10046 SS5]|nr:hypothetical protein AURDEDRAFT_121820 [Auricularia subglabra TFB-10046 SS5]
MAAPNRNNSSHLPADLRLHLENVQHAIAAGEEPQIRQPFSAQLGAAYGSPTQPHVQYPAQGAQYGHPGQSAAGPGPGRMSLASQFALDALANEEQSLHGLDPARVRPPQRHPSIANPGGASFQGGSWMPAAPPPLATSYSNLTPAAADKSGRTFTELNLDEEYSKAGNDMTALEAFRTMVWNAMRDPSLLAALQGVPPSTPTPARRKMTILQGYLSKLNAKLGVLRQQQQQQQQQHQDADLGEQRQAVRFLDLKYHSLEKQTQFLCVISLRGAAYSQNELSEDGKTDIGRGPIAVQFQVCQVRTPGMTHVLGHIGHVHNPAAGDTEIAQVGQRRDHVQGKSPEDARYRHRDDPLRDGLARKVAQRVRHDPLGVRPREDAEPARLHLGEGDVDSGASAAADVDAEGEVQCAGKVIEAQFDQLFAGEPQLDSRDARERGVQEQVHRATILDVEIQSLEVAPGLLVGADGGTEDQSPEHPEIAEHWGRVSSQTKDQIAILGVASEDKSSEMAKVMGNSGYNSFWYGVAWLLDAHHDL